MNEACLAGEIEAIIHALAAQPADDADDAARRVRIAAALAAETGLAPAEATHWVDLVLGPAAAP